MQKEELGGLTCFVKRGSAGGAWVVMLHGYGADAMDLVPLSGIIPQKPEVNWLFPEAPLQVPIGPGMMGRAWFELNMENMDLNAPVEGLKNLIPEGGPKGLDTSLEKLGKALKELGVVNEENREVDAVLAGFSQGSIVCLEWLLKSGLRPRGLMVLSGAPVLSGDLKGRADHLKGLEFFQTHGTEDPILPYQGACDLNRDLEQAGLQGEFLPFQGGHTIGPEAIGAANRYLLKQL